MSEAIIAKKAEQVAIVADKMKVNSEIDRIYRIIIIFLFAS